MWLAYAAGFVDGEGCFTFHKTARLAITNCYPYTLHAFRDAFGGTVSERTVYNERHRPEFRWEVYGGNAREACRALLPYLDEKQRQARVLLEISEWPAGCAQRESLVRELKELKRIAYDEHNL